LAARWTNSRVLDNSISFAVGRSMKESGAVPPQSMDVAPRYRPCFKSNFTTRVCTCVWRAAMIKKLLAIARSAPALTVCVTTSPTSTSTHNPATAIIFICSSNQWETTTTQQTIKPSTNQPFVVIGFDTYEMRPTLKMTNRESARSGGGGQDRPHLPFSRLDYEYARSASRRGERVPEYKALHQVGPSEPAAPGLDAARRGEQIPPYRPPRLKPASIVARLPPARVRIMERAPESASERGIPARFRQRVQPATSTRRNAPAVGGAGDFRHRTAIRAYVR